MKFQIDTCSDELQRIDNCSIHFLDGKCTNEDFDLKAQLGAALQNIAQHTIIG